MFEYVWVMNIGFWFTAGVVQAAITLLILWKIVSVLVDLVWPTKLPLLVPPPHVSDLSVAHRDGHIFVKAKAYGKEYRHHVLVASHDSLKAAATAAQIELVAKIAEDNDGSEHY